MINRCQPFAAALIRAAKSILHSRREYLCLFLALLLTQTFFWLILLTGLLEGELLCREAARLYDYHAEIVGLDHNQLALLENDPYTAFADEMVYTIRSITPVTDVYGNVTYTVRLVFREGRDLRDFTVRYGDALRAARYSDDSEILTATALGSAKSDAENARRTAFLLTLPLAAAACGLLTFLYQLRIGHYRFTYGVCMAFGADCRQLRRGALAEMLLLSLAALPCSFGGAALIRQAINRVTGAPFVFSRDIILPVLLLNLAMVTVAVRAPMRLLADKPPIRLILARDNTAAVSSPRRSVNFLPAPRREPPALPPHYAAVTRWRFRRYYARLLIPAVLFSSLGVFAVSLGDINRIALSQPLYAATLRAGGREIDDLPPLLRELDGVQYLDLIYRPRGIPADDPVSFSGRRDLLLLPADRIRPQFGGYFVSSAEPGFSATLFAQYEAVTADSIAELLRAAEDPAILGCNFTVEGDLSSVLTQPRTLLLTDSIYNQQYLDLRPGDKIRLASFKSGPPIDPLSTNGNMQILMQAIVQIWKFDYHEYTVGAILHGLPAGQYLTVGLAPDDYGEILGEPPRLQKIRAALDPALPPDARAALAAELDYLCSVWSLPVGSSSEIEAAFSRRAQSSALGKDGVLRAAAGLSAGFAPLIWFFSQALFYAGREKEFVLLAALGLPASRLRRLYLGDGLFCAVTALLLTLGASLALTHLFHLLFNHLLYAYGFIHLSFRITPGLSLPMILFCLALSLLSGFASSVFPYIAFLRKANRAALYNPVKTDEII